MNNLKDVFDKNVREKILNSTEKLEVRLTEAKVVLARVNDNFSAGVSKDQLREVSLELAQILYGGHQLQKAKERLYATRTTDKLVVWAYNAVANLADRIDNEKSQIEANLRGE